MSGAECVVALRTKQVRLGGVERMRQCLVALRTKQEGQGVEILMK